MMTPEMKCLVGPEKSILVLSPERVVSSLLPRVAQNLLRSFHVLRLAVAVRPVEGEQAALAWRVFLGGAVVCNSAGLLKCMLSQSWCAERISMMFWSGA